MKRLFLIFLPLCFGCVRHFAAVPSSNPKVQAEVTPVPAEQFFKALPPYHKSYVVHVGDTLWSLAGKVEVLGDHRLWPILAIYNSDQCPDPNRIQPGIELTWPNTITEDEEMNAFESARLTKKFQSWKSKKYGALNGKPYSNDQQKNSVRYHEYIRGKRHGRLEKN